MLADIADDFYALWLSLPGGMHWLLLGWAVLYLLVRGAEFYSRRIAWDDIGAWVNHDHEEKVERATGTASVGLVDLPADFAGAPGMQWWRCRHCGRGRVFEGTFEQEAREASDHEARCAHRCAAFAVAAEPVSLVEPDVCVCAECGAPKDPMDGLDDLLRGVFEPEAAEPGLTGWKPGMPPWGTPPWQGQENDAAARLFRQRISDALRRHETGEQK